MTFRAAAVAIALAAALPVAVPAGAEESEPRIEAEVVSVDRARSEVTLRGSDGETFVFKASEETLADLEPGDRIEAERRTGGR